MKKKNPTLEKIKNIDYSSFVSLIDERNRCSGGINSIREVIVNSRINEKSKVLEIGSNTGFTAVNLVYLCNCKVTGMDINKEVIKKAKKYAKKNKLNKKIRFLKGDALNIKFPKNYFDLVWASNTTSFINKKGQAIKEYLRVLKIGGTLSIIPIYYKKRPPKNIVQKISKALNIKINVYSKKDWKKIIDEVSKKFNIPLELYFEKDYGYKDVKDNIHNFVVKQLKKGHLKNLSEEKKKLIKKRAENFYYLFNENLKYCGFSILLYQKRYEKDEEELFVTK